MNYLLMVGATLVAKVWQLPEQCRTLMMAETFDR
jgi:hypothetical protein